LTVAVLAQVDPPTLTINKFFGINTSANPLTLQPGEAVKAINVDFSISGGAINKREGLSVFHDALDNTTGYTGNYDGIFSYCDRAGNKRLFATFQYDSSNAGFKAAPWALIIKSGEYKVGMTDSLGGAYPFQYFHSPFYGAIYNDLLIYSNGYNRPLYSHKAGTFHSLVSMPPGMFDLAPFAETTTTSANLLDGDYYYAIWAAYYDSVGGDPTWGYPYGSANNKILVAGLSPKIHVDSDWVIIYAPESMGWSIRRNYDRSVIRILRTRAGRHWGDSLFLIGTDTVLETGSLATWHFIDSIKDASLGTGAYVFVNGYVDTSIYAQDTVTDEKYLMGSPKWISTLTDVSAPRVYYGGVSTGMGSADSGWWTYTDYAVAYYDSITGMISQIGPVCRIPVSYRCASGCIIDTIYDTAYSLGLDSLNAWHNHLWRLLCRRLVTQERRIQSDTTYMKQDVRAEWNTQYAPGSWVCRWSDGSVDWSGSQLYIGNDGKYWCHKSALRIIDTTIQRQELTEWRIIDTLKVATDTDYVDNMTWPAWRDKDALPMVTTIMQLKYPTVYGERIFMVAGNRVYYSGFEIGASAPGYWPLGAAHDINVDDGDEITAQYVDDDGNLLEFKNNSIYMMWDAGEAFADKQIISGVGCIAPKSIISMPGGGIAFLHSTGIWTIGSHWQSPYKESGGTLSKLSGPIDNHLEAMTIGQKRGCTAWRVPEKDYVVFSFPTVDTSYVFFPEYGWVQWDFSFKQVANYDTTYQTDNRPSLDVLGILNANDAICKFGAVKTDTGVAVTAYWKSGPLFVTPEYGSIAKYGLWTQAALSRPITMIFTDQTGTTKQTITDSSGYYYRHKSTTQYDANYWQVEIQSAMDSLAIRAIDFWWKTTGAMPDY
jgi:hypothetical protein